MIDKNLYPSIPFNFNNPASVEQMFAKILRMLPDETERGIIGVVMNNKDNPHYRRVYASYLEKMGRDEEADAEYLAAEKLEEMAKQLRREPQAPGTSSWTGMVASGAICSGMIGAYFISSGHIISGPLIRISGPLFGMS